ncbi:retrovirus-related pol polyprotein from transposon TNT 1-94, partial [Tanacetum coccineum]
MGGARGRAYAIDGGIWCSPQTGVPQETLGPMSVRDDRGGDVGGFGGGWRVLMVAAGVVVAAMDDGRRGGDEVVCRSVVGGAWDGELIKIILFIVDSGCSKNMTGNLKLLTNFVEKFLGTVKFGNYQIAPILGYGDLVQGNITIKRVYYVEGLNHNLFFVGQFCDADLEVAFWKSTCYVCDLKGYDLLKGSRGTDLYSITLQNTDSPNPICLMAKATSSQAWLWHRRLSHLNFDSINMLSKNDIVIGLPKLKFVKDHLCSSCELGKAKRKSFPTKTTPSSRRRLQILHMDLCGPIRVESINGKKYVLVIVDDYS